MRKVSPDWKLVHELLETGWDRSDLVKGDNLLEDKRRLASVLLALSGYSIWATVNVPDYEEFTWRENKLREQVKDWFADLCLAEMCS